MKLKSNIKLYEMHGEKINTALEMFEYKIKEEFENRLVSVYKVKECFFQNYTKM